MTDYKTLLKQNVHWVLGVERLIVPSVHSVHGNTVVVQR